MPPDNEHTYGPIYNPSASSGGNAAPAARVRFVFLCALGPNPPGYMGKAVRAITRVPPPPLAMFSAASTTFRSRNVYGQPLPKPRFLDRCAISKVRGFWCNLNCKPHVSYGRLFYYAANTAFQTAGVLLSLRRNLPRLNWPLLIRRTNSMPAITIDAVVNHLKPSIGPMRSFTPR